MEGVDHRKLGIELFNFTWTLIDKKERSRDDEDEMVHAAHASRFHWGKVGKPVNLARGEWQISRVYSILRRGEPALHHARRTLAICEENGIGDFDIAFAHEALARAHAVSGSPDEARRRLALARELTAKVADEEDRKILEADLATIAV